MQSGEVRAAIGIAGQDLQTPLRSATAATVAPGSSASDMIRSFSAVGQWRRRSTLEMTSDTMCLTVLTRVLKDSILHLIRRSSASQHGRSREGSLTDRMRGISVVKRRHLLDRCRYRGECGMQRWVGLGVIADNLVNIGRVL